MLVAIGGRADIVTERINITLAPKDAMIFEAGDPEKLTAIPRADIDLFLIEIWYR